MSRPWDPDDSRSMPSPFPPFCPTTSSEAVGFDFREISIEENGHLLAIVKRDRKPFVL